MDKIKQLSNLRGLPDNLQGSALVLLDFLDEYKGKFEAIEGVLSEINTKEVKTYTEELKTLHNSILSLVDSFNNKDTVVNIPLDKLSEQLVKVETAIKNIKEVKIPEFPEFPNELRLKEEQINQILVAIETIPDFPMNELKTFIDKLSKELFKRLEDIKPESPEKIDYDFFYDAFKRLEKAVKGISISISGGGVDTSNLATEETLQSITGNQYVSSNIDTEDATNYYFLSFIPGTTKWRINRLNKTSYVSDYAIWDSDINTAWTNRASQTYAIIY